MTEFQMFYYRDFVGRGLMVTKLIAQKNKLYSKFVSSLLVLENFVFNICFLILLLKYLIISLNMNHHMLIQNP